MRKDNVMKRTWLLAAAFTALAVAASAAELKALPKQVLTGVVLQIGTDYFDIGEVTLVQIGNRWILVVGPVLPTPVPPGPVPPGPTPPVPGPVTPFRDAVKAAFDLVGAAGRADAAAIAAVYSGVAGEAEANPAGWTVKQMVAEVKTRNASAISVAGLGAWKPFWPALAKAMESLKLEDTDVAKAVAAFRDVSAVIGG